jgi:FkbM family methyltransferase
MIVDRFVKEASDFTPHTIVHVGANYAQELERYEALAPRRVVWIEADSRIAAAMKSSVERRAGPGVDHICVEALVTDSDAKDAAFNIFSNEGGSSSVFTATETFRRHWPDVIETGEVRTLKSSRLDTLLRKLSVEPGEVDVLVVDIQGAELLCLKGSGAYLERAVFIEVEASSEAVYNGGVLFPELDQYLRNAGFARVSRVPWHGDVVYVGRSALARAGFRRLRRLAAHPDKKKRRWRIFPTLLRRMSRKTK